MKSMFTGRSRLPMTALPMLVTALVSTNLDADTVAWYHFDEVAPGAPVTSDVRFLNTVNPEKLQGRPYSVGEPGREQYSNLGSHEAFMPVATNAVGDTVVVSDPEGKTSCRNERSLFFRYADHDEKDRPARYGGCVQVASDASLSLADAVTVEFFVLPVRLTERTNNGWQIVSKQSSGTGKFTYSICLSDKGVPYVNVYGSNGSLAGTTGINNFKGSKSFLDGKWHHIAFTVSGTTAKLYCDYILEDTATLTEKLYYVDDAPLYIGASQMGYYMPGGFVDEVRISDVVLEPLQFLRYADTADMQFHAGFEGSFNADVPHLIDPGVGVGTAGRIVSGMSLPAFTNCVPGRYIVDGSDSSTMRTNALSVLFEGGDIRYPHNVELEMPEMTVECFMKHHASSNYAGILRFSKSNLYVANPIWFVGVQNGQLFMRIDTATKENQGWQFGTTFLDGRWHHLGVTFSTNGLGQAVVRVYDNYRQVGTDWTLDGPLDFSKGSVLHVGRSSDKKYLFYGCIDEVRISRGVLDPDDFLRVFNGGLNVILR